VGFRPAIRRGSEIRPFLPYLTLGENVHVGKNAAFGNGWYWIEEQPDGRYRLKITLEHVIAGKQQGCEDTVTDQSKPDPGDLELAKEFEARLGACRNCSE